VHQQCCPWKISLSRSGELLAPFAIRAFRIFLKFLTALIRIYYRVIRLYTFYSDERVNFSQAWLLAFGSHCVGRFLGGAGYVPATKVFQFEPRGNAAHGATCLVRLQGFFRCFSRKLKPPLPGRFDQVTAAIRNVLLSGGKFRSVAGRCLGRQL